MRGLFNRIQDLLGIYGTGFAAESLLGILLPLAFVVLVGGLGAVLVLIRYNRRRRARGRRAP